MFYYEALAALFSAILFDMGWVLLKAYESEAEARVVESFLTSHDVPVQLLGTFSRYTVMVPGLSQRAGMRLLVPDADLMRAKELLLEQERATHLSIAEPHVPVKHSYWHIALLLALFALGAIFLLERI